MRVYCSKESNFPDPVSDTEELQKPEEIGRRTRIETTKGSGSAFEELRWCLGIAVAVYRPPGVMNNHEQASAENHFLMNSLVSVSWPMRTLPTSIGRGTFRE